MEVLNKMFRKYLQIALDDLKKDVKQMAALVTTNISDALKAFIESDKKLAGDIIKRDALVDELEDLIAKKAVEIIWREQPIASDLRLVTGIYKLITDLERIGDHATDIALIVLKTETQKEKRVMPKTTEMARVALEMVTNSVEAFLTLDTNLAKNTILEDDIVDNLLEDVIAKTIENIESDHIDSKYSVYLLFIAKYLERVADHATNICEWLLYIVS